MATTIKKDFGNTRNRKPDTSTLVYGKVPPQAPDLEEAVLGACILERDTFEMVLEILRSEDCFYIDAHQKIYGAMRRLIQKGTPVDLLTITEELRKTNELELIGGAYFLTRLSMSVMSSAHVEAHARIVMEKFIQREMIRVSGAVMSEAYEDSTDAFELLDKAENEYYQLSSVGVKKKVKPIRQGVIETMKKINTLIERNVDFTGINTGFPKLNECTGGWQKTDLIILAARPSVGKTAVALNLAMNAAADRTYGGPVAIFNLEMSQDQIIERMLSCISAVPLSHIRQPKRLTQEEHTRLNKAYEILSQLNLHIDDTAGLTSMELRTKCRKLVSQDGVKLIIIDYLQLMECERDRGENREQQISKISRDLKKLAKDLNVPILALSQMSRSVDTMNREPQLSDLRESGAIEQDADMVMFLYRPTEKTLEKKPHLKGKVLGTIKKNRNGALDDVVFNANNHIQRWIEHEGDGFGNAPIAGRAQTYYVPGLPAGSIAFDNTPNYNPSPETIDDLPF